MDCEGAVEDSSVCGEGGVSEVLSWNKAGWRRVEEGR